uniref:Retrovirus-related Pol polyprotein from transposon TNT 1-94 n=1 Tax=Tanacetum cinerariifolium TaxID=118510 RepID=A0A6L2LQK1_TANCI|nr:retrovirus-related Pol polyprotein from transposon TNT 1-94 [Tanacetum cinerariifolium]
MAPLTFADTHNMIAFLTKSDASEGFDQIVDFLTAHPIQYALMVNPTIYVSCIKQFWASMSIKKSNDAVKLQALIDRKKIFAELAQMGYEKSSTKLTFYKAFFSAQWKFLIHTIVQYDLSSYNTKYTSFALTQKVFANIRKIGKGFSGVETPLFDSMLVQQQVQDDADVQEDEDDNDTCATFTKKVANLEQDKIAQALEITKIKKRVRKLEKKMRIKHSGLERLRKDTDEVEPTEVEEVLEVVTAAKLMTEVVTTAASITTVAQVSKPSAPKKRRGIVIQDLEDTTAASVIVHSEDKAFARQLEAELNVNINWNDVLEQVKRREKEENTVKRYQALKRKHVIEDQIRKNMMIYLKNMAGFKMDFFKGMTYSEKRPIFEKHYNSIRTFLEKEEEEVKNFDKEDLEALWKLVKEIFESTEPNNFSNDFLLNTFKIMFEKPNVEANVWIDQKGRYGLAKVKSWKQYESCRIHIITLTTTQMILLVEKKYLLTHFTLKQMLNNVRLEVEEESKMSLELLRVNERHMQTIEEKVDTSKALDASLVDTKSSGAESVEQDIRSRSGNDAHADDADIIPIYDEEPMAEFLISKDEAPYEIKTFLKKITVLLQALVFIVRTDNGMKFKNQVLQEYFNSVSIFHQAFSVRTQQQNEVEERGNRTLMESARTMLIFSRVSLFLWAKAIATACYTQNRSIIHRQFEKTPYELIKGRKPDIFFLYVFEALCYPKNDRKDIGKLCAQAMHDGNIGGQPLAALRTVLVAQAPQVLQTPTTSTTIADTAPTPTNSSSQATKFPNTSQDVDELETHQQHSLNAMLDGNMFVNPFATPSTSAAESSFSQYMDRSNMHADYAGCKDTFKSTFNGAQFLGEKLVSWSSKKHDCTLTDYGFHFNKIPIYCDSKLTIAISCNPFQHSIKKHIAVRYHFIKEHVEKGMIELYFIKMDYQMADLFTKALLVDRFNYLGKLFGNSGNSQCVINDFSDTLIDFYGSSWKYPKTDQLLSLKERSTRSYRLSHSEFVDIEKKDSRIKIQRSQQSRQIKAKDHDINILSKNIKLKIKIHDHKHAKETSKEFPRLQGSKTQDVPKSEATCAMTTP